MLRSSNAIFPGLFCIAWFFGTAMAPSPAAADTPRVLSVSPSFAALHDGKGAPTKVVIRANVSLDKATAVFWGKQSVPKSGFTVQHDGSITTNACCSFQSASTFPVTVVMDGQMLPSDATARLDAACRDVIDFQRGGCPRRRTAGECDSLHHRVSTARRPEHGQLYHYQDLQHPVQHRRQQQHR